VVKVSTEVQSVCRLGSIRNGMRIAVRTGFCALSMLRGESRTPGREKRTRSSETGRHCKIPHRLAHSRKRRASSGESISDRLLSL